MARRFYEPMSYVTWPLDMYKQIPEASKFQQTQVIMPQGGGGGDFDFGSMFSGMMQKMQQQKAMQQQMQEQAGAVQSLVPQLKNMGYDIDTINSLFKNDPDSLIKAGMQHQQFMSNQEAEMNNSLKRARLMHDQEVQMNQLTPDQLNLVDKYRQGQVKWEDLTQYIPSDKMDKALELNAKGMNLQKAAILGPLDIEEKQLKVQHDRLVNGNLPDKLKADLEKSYQSITKTKHDIINSDNTHDLNQQRFNLEHQKFLWQKHIQQANLNLRMQGKNKNSNPEFKQFDAELKSKATPDEMFKFATSKGFKIPGPSAPTLQNLKGENSQQYMNRIKGLIQQQSSILSKQGQDLSGQKSKVESDLDKAKRIVTRQTQIEKLVADPKTSDAEAAKLVKESQSLGKELKNQTYSVAGYKLSTDEYHKYLQYDPEKKKRFIQFLMNKGR